MKRETKELKKYLEKAEKILILGHKSPDMDAFCSMLLTYRFIKELYPQKEITMKAKQSPNTNLPLMENIQIVEKINYSQEDLIIVVDANDILRCIVEGEDDIHMHDVEVVSIDHHKEMNDNSISRLTINEFRSSATEQVYVLFKEIFGKKFKLDNDISSLVQYGIISDTGRFLFDNATSDTYRIFAEVKDFYSVDVEDFTYKSSKFPSEATLAIVKYLENLKIEKDMAYTYISQKSIQESDLTKQGINEGQSFLRDNYLRYIQGVHWGFIIKPTFEIENKWYVSFRSTKGYQDVGVIAKSLGGGGHTYASACPVTAESVEEALEVVLNAVKKFSS